MADLPTQITAAYELDSRRKAEKVFSAADLPRSYEAITNEWLTDVLCKDHPGAAVVGFKLDLPDNGSANRQRIAVEYNEAGARAKLPTELFCKATHDLVNRLVLGTSGGAHAEVTFYNRLRPLLKIEAPRCFFAKYDPQTFNSIIVLGDLSRTVREFCSHHTQMPRPRVESQLRLLGELHGSCYRDPELKAALQGLVTWPQFFQNTLAFGMKDGSNAGFLAAKEVIPPRLFRRSEDIWPRTLISVERHDHLPLRHGRFLPLRTP